jgi:hypothetical protein
MLRHANEDVDDVRPNRNDAPTCRRPREPDSAAAGGVVRRPCHDRAQSAWLRGSAMTDVAVEQRVLKLSVVLSGVLGGLAVTLGLLSGSMSR